MDSEFLNRLDAQDRKLEEIYASVEKIRRYILWTVIGTVIAFVLPLIALAFAIPWFLSVMSSTYSGLL